MGQRYFRYAIYLIILPPQVVAAPLLHEALEVAGSIGSDSYRTKALTSLAPQLAALPLATLYPLWCETLRFLAERKREGLLRDLQALVLVIEALGGEEAVKEAVQVVQDVGRWWP